MKFITQNRKFFSDFSITKNLKSTSSKVFIFLSLLFFLSNYSKLNASNKTETLQQKPTTKTPPKPSPSTTKVDKTKLKARLNKTKKKVVVQKDTLQDIDPANTGTPLYKNDN